MGIFIGTARKENQMKIIKSIFTAILTAVCLTAMCSCGHSGRLAFGTGNVGGSYYSYAGIFSQLVSSDNENITFDIKNTEGSAANIRLLQKGFLDAAIAQSDMLAEAYSGSGVFEDSPCRGVRAIAALYTEECQIVVKADSGIESVSDLYGKRVSVGEKESGVKKNAEEILFVNGLSYDVIDEEFLSFSDSAAALEDGSIDAFFCTAGAPTGAVYELARNTDISILSLDDRTVERMLKEYSGYTECTIPAGTYCGQEEDVRTVGVKAVLVTNKKLSKDTASQLLNTLISHGSELRYATVAGEINAEYAAADIPIPFHDGAKKWYEEHGVDVSQTADGSKKEGTV